MPPTPTIATSTTPIQQWQALGQTMTMTIWAATGQMSVRWQQPSWAANAATGTDDSNGDGNLGSQGSDGDKDDNDNITEQPMPPQGQTMTMVTTWTAKGQMATKMA